MKRGIHCYDEDMANQIYYFLCQKARVSRAHIIKPLFLKNPVWNWSVQFEYDLSRSSIETLYAEVIIYLVNLERMSPGAEYKSKVRFYYD